MAVGALHVEVSGALVEEAWFRRCRRVYGNRERREVMKGGSDRCVEEASCIGRTRTEEGMEVGWKMEHCICGSERSGGGASGLVSRYGTE
jgi:hypothetical protein